MSHQQSDETGGHQAIFRFTYRSMPFRVLHHSSETSNEGILEGELGVIPFTGDGDERRSNTLAVLEATRHMPGCRVRIRLDHSINLTVKLPPAEHASADRLLADAIETLAGVKKLLDLLQSFQPPHLRART